MKRVFALGLALAVPAFAAPQAPKSAVDPARLAAAREVVSLAMPPATRDAMLAQMSTAMANNMRQGMLGNPQMKAMFAQDPRLQPIFDRYMTRIQARTAETIRSGMPPLYDAMGRAYARRFTLPQLADLKAFFQTPTGRYYATQAGTIMADPDIAAAQSAMMGSAMTATQTDVKAMVAEIQALPPRKPAG